MILFHSTLWYTMLCCITLCYTVLHFSTLYNHIMRYNTIRLMFSQVLFGFLRFFMFPAQLFLGFALISQVFQVLDPNYNPSKTKEKHYSADVFLGSVWISQVSHISGTGFLRFCLDFPGFSGFGPKLQFTMAIVWVRNLNNLRNLSKT